MAKADILLSAGIKFSPRDVDTKAIKDAVVRALSTTRIDIKRVRIGREARTALEDAIRRTQFRIDQAKFGRTGLAALRNQFRQNEFRIDKVQFTSRALNSLNSQLKKTPFEIAQAKPATPQGRGQGADAARGLAASQDQLARSTQSATDKFRQQVRGLAEVATNTTFAERANRNFINTVVQGSTSLQGFGANIIKITQRFAAYLVSIKAILAAQQAFNASIQFIFEFDSALTDLEKITSTLGISAGSLADDLFAVGNNTANAVTAVAESFSTFIRQGEGVEEALRRTEAALIGVNVAGTSVGDATKLVTTALQVFGSELSGPIEALDILIKTADNAATNANQITQAILRSGSAAKAVGVNFNQLNAIIAATVEQTQLSGNQIGSALKTIFARLATNTSGFNELANALGANIQPGDTLFETLQKIAEIFPTLDRTQRANLAAAAAGKRRFTEFNAVLANFDKTVELLEKNQDSAGDALRKNEIALGSLESRAQLARNAFSEFVSELANVPEGEGISGLLKSGLDVITELGTGLTGLVKGAKDLDLGFGSLFDVITKIGGAAFFVLAPIAIKSIFQGARAFLGIGVQLNTVIGNLAKQQAGVTAAVSATTGVAQRELGVQTQITGQLARQVQLKNQDLRLSAAKLQAVRAGGSSADVSAALGSNANKASKGLGGLAKQIGVFALVLQGVEFATEGLNNIADSLESSGSKLGADFTRAGGEALALGAQFALLGGPLVGAVAAVTLLSKKLVDASVEFTVNELAAAQAAESIGAMRVALGQVPEEARDLVQALREFDERVDSTDPREQSEVVVDAIRFVSRSLEVLGRDSSNLSTAFRGSAVLLRDVTRDVAGAIRETNIADALNNIVKGIQERATAAQVGGAEAAGGARGNLTETQQIQAKIAGLVGEQREGLLTIEQIEGELSRLALAREISLKSQAEQQELNVNSTEELLERTGAVSDRTKQLADNAKEITDRYEEQFSELEKILGGTKEGLELVDLYRSELQKQSEELGKSNKQLDFASVLTRQLVKDGKLRKDVEADVLGLSKNLSDSLAQQTDIQSQLTESRKADVKRFDEVIPLVKNLTAATAADLDNVELQNRARANTISKVKAQADAQTAILRASAQANTFEEQVALTKQRSVQAAQEAINKANENLAVDERRLATARAIAVAAGDNTVVKAIDQQIARLAQLRTEQEGQIRTEFSIKLRTELETQALEQFKAAESQLRDFRIQQINEVLRQEQAATDRRIEFLRRISDSSIADDVVQRQGLRGRAGDERDFGTVTAAILRQFEEGADQTSAAIEARLQQLRVNGVNTFDELNSLQARQRELAKEVVDLTESGADPGRLRTARVELELVGAELGKIKDRGVEVGRELTALQAAEGEERVKREEVLAVRREAALKKVEDAADRVNKAEEALVAARNKIPAANQKIIQAQRGLAAAESRVEDATKSLSAANQQLADANFQLAFNVGLAEFKAKQASGGFGSVSQAIGSLQSAFESAVRESRGSFEAILNARREVLQEEVSLVQNQLSAIRGLANRAFTADPEQLAELQQAASIAAGVQSGQISGQELLELPPELRQALTGLTSVFPELQRAIDEAGAEALGLDPSVFQTLESQLVELQTGIAETGQIQVEKAEEGVAAAQAQLEEARQQKDLAQQQLDNAIGQKEALLQSVAAAGQNVSATRAGFRAQVTRSTQILAQNRRTAESNAKIEARQNELITQIQKQATDAAKVLGINTEILTVQKIAQIAAEQTAEAAKETSTKQEATTVEVRTLKERFVDFAVEAIVTWNEAVRLLGQINSKPSSGTANIPSFASGSLSGSEINGLLRAARAEKRAMPGGSKLMLANTSETVLTRRQSQAFGLRPVAKTHAQDGNAVVDGAAFSAVATQLGNLSSQLGQIAQKASQPQQVNVNLESSRSIQVEGINNLESSLQDIVTQRLGTTPSQAEVDTINTTVTELIERMKETSSEDFSNL